MPLVPEAGREASRCGNMGMPRLQQQICREGLYAILSEGAVSNFRDHHVLPLFQLWKTSRAGANEDASPLSVLRWKDSV